MRALITGVTGFCGTHLARRLAGEGRIEIVGVGTAPEPPQGIGLHRYFQVDVTRAAEVDTIVKSVQPEMLFHLAGLSGSTVPAVCMYQVNVTGTVHVLEAVRRHAPECAVLVVGSAAEYGVVDASALPVREDTACRPAGTYGISKYAATLVAMDYARAFGLRVIVARPSNIVGPGVPASLVVGALLARARQVLSSAQPTVTIGDADSERDFVAVEDVVEAYVHLVKGRLSGEVFNICSGKAHSIRYVAEQLLSHAPSPIELIVDPDLLPPSPVRCFYGSYEKAARVVGFRPSISLEDALEATWRSEMGAVIACASRC
jgi:GDP-4-dehydro-6-deoxy-D-mannose reductase